MGMETTTYLVFGDLHGRILPAFHLALAWGREHGVRVAGLLQVGDFGYFPDASRLDKATRRHAEKDPLELGAQLIAAPSKEADALFGRDDLPEALWFIAGNHEDYEALELLAHGVGASPDDFPVDVYGRVRCLRDGHVASLPGDVRVGALWGIDDRAPKARHNVPLRGRIRERSTWELAYAAFDVLLTHDSPRDLVYTESGSTLISSVVHEAKPAFAFFGHYHPNSRVATEIGSTRIFHLHGLEFRGPGRTAEPSSVGVLRWGPDGGTFDYLDSDWLRTVTRDNWQHR
jgi:hypothetical protein